MEQQIDTIIFDLGGVLVDWNPENLFRKVFNNETKMKWFLENVCTPAWNLAHDNGRKIADGVALKVAEFPEYETEIKLYYEDWEYMFSGVIKENLQLFHQLKANKNYKVYALTNWCAEKWEKALELFPFFNEFDGVVVSGQENCVKPNPEIYQIILNRFKINPEKAIFIDDKLENIVGAQKLKLNGIHFKRNTNLKEALNSYKIYL